MHAPVAVKTNKMAKSTYLDSKLTPLCKTKTYLNAYQEFMDPMFHHPKMKPYKMLGTYNELSGDPIEPVYAFVPVIEKGNNLPSGTNHATNVDDKGLFNLVKYLKNHKSCIPACYHVGVGQLSPHNSTEVDCESLFSQAGFLADSLCLNSDICFSKQLVMMAHCLKCIYCIPDFVRDKYM